MRRRYRLSRRPQQTSRDTAAPTISNAAGVLSSPNFQLNFSRPMRDPGLWQVLRMEGATITGWSRLAVDAFQFTTAGDLPGSSVLVVPEGAAIFTGTNGVPFAGGVVLVEQV